MPVVSALSFHADYRCRHAGACCTSAWPIPIEADRLARLRAAMANGQVRPAAGDSAMAIDPDPGAPADTPALLGQVQHRCVFYDQAPSAGAGRCRIHAALGHDALPLACRQFPRVSLHDPRGLSVTLSHYCPTAAALLDADPARPLTIVSDAPAFPAGEYIGLDARTALPPLLRKDLLMDWDSWWACERLAVELFGLGDDAAASLDRLRRAVTEIQTWSPADGPLMERTQHAFARVRSRRPSIAPPDGSAFVEAVFASIPAGVRPAHLPTAAPPTDLALRRFLAAHAFANWTVQLGVGLTAWLRSIEAAAALLEAGASVRQADLLLRHLADPNVLADSLST